MAKIRVTSLGYTGAMGLKNGSRASMLNDPSLIYIYVQVELGADVRQGDPVWSRRFANGWSVLAGQPSGGLAVEKMSQMIDVFRLSLD